VISCKAVGWWKWYWQGFTFIGIVGGLVMLLLAAAIHRTASIPLLIIGGWWIVFGSLALFQGRQTARELHLQHDVVTFVFSKKEMKVPVHAILEMRRTWGDINRFMPIKVRTTQGERLKVVPRMTGLFEFAVELRRLNPTVDMGNLF
jgi:hypothetical protein